MNSNFYALINIKTDGIDERSSMGDFKSVIRHITVNIFDGTSKNIIDTFQSHILNEYVHKIEENSSYKKQLMYTSLRFYCIMKYLDLFLSKYKSTILVFLSEYDERVFFSNFSLFDFDLLKHKKSIITDLMAIEKSTLDKNLMAAEIYCMDYEQKISLMKKKSNLLTL